MATLERPRSPASSSSAAEPSTASFDPSAVPAQPLSDSWQLQDPEDLIALGTEQLFSGSRTARTAPPMARQASTPVVSEELHRSLVAAKHAFVLALTGVLQPTDSPTSSSSEDVVVADLELRVDALSFSLPPTDADLARSLAALLACIERLLSISRVHSPALAQVEYPVPTPTEGSVYAKLEREARALKDARDGAEELVGAARDVERAERDLLWGRVDDLAEQVGGLCRERERVRPTEAQNQPPEDEEKRRQWDREHEPEPSTADAHDHLPRYETEHYPPAYADPSSPSTSWAEKPPRSPPPLEATQLRPRVQGDKMSHDLDLVSAAIERLYLVSPQLANQRVEPDRRLVRERQLATLGNAIERLSRGRLDDQRAAPSPVLDASRTTERLQRLNDAQLDKLIEQIDRAASRTLADQRVDVNAFSSRRGKERQTNRLPTSDPLEVQRREFILEHTGKGRLASQDAAFTTGLFERVSRAPSPGEPVTITEFFKSERSAEDTFPVVRASTPVKKGSSLRLASVFRRGNGAGMSREGSVTGLGLVGSGMSRSPSRGLEDPSDLGLSYIAEESRNLGTIVVTFWSRNPPPAPEPYTVLSISSDRVLIGSPSGTSSLALPSRVIAQSTTITSLDANLHELRLSTLPPSPTHARPDLEVLSPLSTAELRSALPAVFACRTCDAQLVDARSVAKYNALPSEHWAELLDAWMCHQDQTLSDDLVAKGKGIKPREGEALVGAAYVLFAREVTSGWTTPNVAEPTRTETDDNLLPAHCTTCASLIGSHVVPLDRTRPSFLRLLKYATYATASSTGSPLLRYSLSLHLTSALLELGQAHACHRFVLSDAEDDRPRILLWLFNPSIRVTFAPSPPTTRVADDSIGAILGSPSSSSRTLNAVKIFYLVVEDTLDPVCREFIETESATPEEIAYPRAVVRQVRALLEASNGCFPDEKRRYGGMDVGFLERL